MDVPRLLPEGALVRNAFFFAAKSSGQIGQIEFVLYETIDLGSMAPYHIRGEATHDKTRWSHVAYNIYKPHQGERHACAADGALFRTIWYYRGLLHLFFIVQSFVAHALVPFHFSGS